MIVQIDKEKKQIISITIGVYRHLESDEVFVPDNWGTKDIKEMLDSDEDFEQVVLKTKIRLIDVFAE